MAIALAGLLGAFYGVQHMQQYLKTFQSVRVKLLIALAGLFTVAFIVGGLCCLCLTSFRYSKKRGNMYQKMLTSPVIKTIINL